MTKFLSLFCKILITLPVVLFLFFLTFDNRDQIVSFHWSPLNPPVSLSLPIILFLALVVGFVWGSLILWSNTLQLRAERRLYKKRIAELENALAQKQIDRQKALREKPSQELLS